MKIEFNKVTWYSKLAALIVFVVGIPALTFYIGRQYEEVAALRPMKTTHVAPTEKGSANLSGPTFKDPLNGTFTFDDEAVTFVQGTYSSPDSGNSDSVRGVHVFGTPKYGDLSGDGLADAIFFVYEESGGTGTFFYAVAAENHGGVYTGTNAVLLGDRIAPQTITIDGGVAAVNYADRKPDDPMVAEPTVGKTKYLSIKDGQLVEVTANTQN